MPLNRVELAQELAEIERQADDHRAAAERLEVLAVPLRQVVGALELLEAVGNTDTTTAAELPTVTGPTVGATGHPLAPRCEIPQFVNLAPQPTAALPAEEPPRRDLPPPAPGSLRERIVTLLRDRYDLRESPITVREMAELLGVAGPTAHQRLRKPLMLLIDGGTVKRETGEDGAWLHSLAADAVPQDDVEERYDDDRKTWQQRHLQLALAAIAERPMTARELAETMERAGVRKSAGSWGYYLKLAMNDRLVKRRRRPGSFGEVWEYFVPAQEAAA